MCEDKLDDHITRLEAENVELKELCGFQRRALEIIFEAWDGLALKRLLYWIPGFANLADVLTAVQAASTMTGTSEEG